eukprot:scaffold1042_cov401-Prasinococcus_capsulatus_cf.AAC.57
MLQVLTGYSQTLTCAHLRKARTRWQQPVHLLSVGKGAPSCRVRFVDMAGLWTHLWLLATALHAAGDKHLLARAKSSLADTFTGVESHITKSMREFSGPGAQPRYIRASLGGQEPERTDSLHPEVPSTSEEVAWPHFPARSARVLDSGKGARGTRLHVHLGRALRPPLWFEGLRPEVGSQCACPDDAGWQFALVRGGLFRTEQELASLASEQALRKRLQRSHAQFGPVQLPHSFDAAPPGVLVRIVSTCG